MGKTRLAVEVAARLREQHPAAPGWSSWPASPIPRGRSGRGRNARGRRPALSDAQSPGSTAELIAHHLAGRSLIVVLDNCEHVIDPAAALADTLVGKVPGLRLMATSREPLGVPGEILVPVAGLASPAAVELFVDRARRSSPASTATARPKASSTASAVGWTASPGHRARRRPPSSPPSVHAGGTS